MEKAELKNKQDKQDEQDKHKDTLDWLNLARPILECPISELHGPHKRLVLWVQGCSVKCTENCINPAALNDVIRYQVSVDEALAQIKQRLANTADVEGVTILGGEPTDQARSLALLLKALRQEGLGVMLYSGHTFDKLKRLSKEATSMSVLLAQVDLLIDGPFIDKLYDYSLLWRGSSNQGIRCLSTRYESEALANAPVMRGVDIVLSAEGRLHLSGMHNPQLSQEFEHVLKRITDLQHA